MPPKKMLLCEVLTTIKGLDPKKPQDYTHAGTADAPTLVELSEVDALELIEASAVRVWPGHQVQTAPSAPLKPAELKSLKKAEEVLPRLIEHYAREMAAAEGDEDTGAIKALIAEAEADLESVRELLK